MLAPPRFKILRHSIGRPKATSPSDDFIQQAFFHAIETCAFILARMIKCRAWLDFTFFFLDGTINYNYFFILRYDPQMHTNFYPKF